MQNTPLNMFRSITPRGIYINEVVYKYCYLCYYYYIKYRLRSYLETPFKYTNKYHIRLLIEIGPVIYVLVIFCIPVIYINIIEPFFF